MKITKVVGLVYDKYMGQTSVYKTLQDEFITPWAVGELLDSKPGYHTDNGAVAFGKYEYGNEINFKTGEIGEGFFNPRPKMIW